MREVLSTSAALDRNDVVADFVVSSVSRLYAVNPALSMPAASWVEADPEFWKRP